MPRIRLFPDPVLRRTAEPVVHFDAHLLSTVKIMEQVLRRQRHGIGIAAPQMGIARRIAVVDVSPRVPGASRLILVNPEILEGRKERPSREGCMSIPDYAALVKRFDEVLVRWQEPAGGRFHERWCSGIEAVCVQHEVDHLNGLLFIDRVASLKRDMIPREG